MVPLVFPTYTQWCLYHGARKSEVGCSPEEIVYRINSRFHSINLETPRSAQTLITDIISSTELSSCPTCGAQTASAGVKVNPRHAYMCLYIAHI